MICGFQCCSWRISHDITQRITTSSIILKLRKFLVAAIFKLLSLLLVSSRRYYRHHRTVGDHQSQGSCLQTWQHLCSNKDSHSITQVKAVTGSNVITINTMLPLLVAAVVVPVVNLQPPIFHHLMTYLKPRRTLRLRIVNLRTINRSYLKSGAYRKSGAYHISSPTVNAQIL
jgi:hypothetical protein